MSVHQTLAHQGQSDAPIIVGSIDSFVYTTGILLKENLIFQILVAIDVWDINNIGPYNNGHV